MSGGQHLVAAQPFVLIMAGRTVAQKGWVIRLILCKSIATSGCNRMRCKAYPAHLNALTVAVLLLKGHKALVHRVRLILGYVVQGISEDGPRPVMLFAALLKLCELDEELLLQGSLLISKDPLLLPCQRPRLNEVIQSSIIWKLAAPAICDPSKGLQQIPGKVAAKRLQRQGPVSAVQCWCDGSCEAWRAGLGHTV